MSENETAPALARRGGRSTNTGDHDHSASQKPSPFSYSVKLKMLINAARDSRLIRTDLAVFSAILDHANDISGATFVGVPAIVAESGVPRTTALRALGRIESAGWMTVDRRIGARSTYTLTGSTDGTSPTTGTSPIWSRSGSASGLQTGPTAVDKTSPAGGPVIGYLIGKATSRAIDKSRGRKQSALLDVALPECVPQKSWDEFVEHRKQIRKPMTPLAAEKQLAQLVKFHDSGSNVVELIDNAIANGWQGIFDSGTKGSPRARKSAGASFAGKVYEGTPDDELPAGLLSAGGRV